MNSMGSDPTWNDISKTNDSHKRLGEDHPLTPPLLSAASYPSLKAVPVGMCWNGQTRFHALLCMFQKLWLLCVVTQVT